MKLPRTRSLSDLCGGDTQKLYVHKRPFNQTPQFSTLSILCPVFLYIHFQFLRVLVWLVFCGFISLFLYRLVYCAVSLFINHAQYVCAFWPHILSGIHTYCMWAWFASHNRECKLYPCSTYLGYKSCTYNACS